MTHLRYTVLLEAVPDEGGFTVTVPELPGCITQGETVEGALAMAHDAVTLYLQEEKDAPLPDADGAIVATVTVDESVPTLA